MSLPSYATDRLELNRTMQQVRFSAFSYVVA